MNVIHNRRQLVNITVAVALLLAGSLLAFIGEQIVSAIMPHPPFWFLLLLFILAVLIVGWLTHVAMQRAGRVLGSTVRVSMPEREEPRRFFLTGYSPLRGPVTAEKVLEHVQGMSLEDLKADRAEADRRKLPNLGPWHQSARAVLFHASRLEEIRILRPDTNDDEFEMFIQFLRGCLEKAGNTKVRIRQIHFPGEPDIQFQMTGRTGNFDPPSYEDYEYVYEGFREGLKQLRQNVDWSEDDVCIDVTPGFKPYSIAAAVITFNQGLKFSYVNMEGQIRFYDAEITFHA